MNILYYVVKWVIVNIISKLYFYVKLLEILLDYLDSFYKLNGMGLVKKEYDHSNPQSASFQNNIP